MIVCQRPVLFDFILILSFFSNLNCVCLFESKWWIKLLTDKYEKRWKNRERGRETLTDDKLFDWMRAWELNVCRVASIEQVNCCDNNVSIENGPFHVLHSFHCLNREKTINTNREWIRFLSMFSVLVSHTHFSRFFVSFCLSWGRLDDGNRCKI